MATKLFSQKGKFREFKNDALNEGNISQGNPVICCDLINKNDIEISVQHDLMADVGDSPFHLNLKQKQ